MKLYIHGSENSDFVTDEIILVPASKDDLDLIIEAEIYTTQELYGDEEMPDEVIDELIQDSKDSVGRTRMILLNDEPIGILQAYELESYWYIGEIYLKEEYRDQGIGRDVLEYEIDNHSDEILCLNVYKTNTHAIELYESLGFEVTEEDDERYIMKLYPD